MTASDTDEDLLLRSAKGDEGAFTALYRRRQASVYRFAFHMCGSAEIAEEVTQEVFLALIRQPERFQPARGSVASFLLGIARNQVLRCLGSRKRDVPVSDYEDDLAPVEPDLLAELTREQTVEAVRQAVLALPEAYREAIVLCDLQEVSYAEAAEALNVPLGTVRSRVNRGRALLTHKLSRGTNRSAVRCSA